MKVAADRCPFCFGEASSSTCLNSRCSVTTFESGEDCYPHAVRVTGRTNNGATVIRWLITDKARRVREEDDMVTIEESAGCDAE